MRVLVCVAVRPPTDQPPLDDLQRHGAAAVINNIIGRAVDATGPNGELITVADSQVAAHPEGVEIGVVIDTPHRSAPVGDLVTDLVAQILETTQALAGWVIATVTVEELPSPAAPGRARPRRPRRRHVRPGRR